MSDEDKDDDKKESGDGEEGGEGGGGRSFSPLKIGLFVGLPLLLVLGGLGTAYVLGLFDSLFGHGAKEEAAVHEEVPHSTSAFIDIPRLTVNLATTGNQRALLQIAVSLEVKDALLVPQIEPQLPRVLDAFQVFLRELRVEDLAGTRGTMRIKEELLTRVNAAVAPLKIDDVLFKEMLVQ